MRLFCKTWIMFNESFLHYVKVLNFYSSVKGHELLVRKFVKDKWPPALAMNIGRIGRRKISLDDFAKPRLCLMKLFYAMLKFFKNYMSQRTQTPHKEFVEDKRPLKVRMYKFAKDKKAVLCLMTIFHVKVNVLKNYRFVKVHKLPGRSS